MNPGLFGDSQATKHPKLMYWEKLTSLGIDMNMEENCRCSDHWVTQTAGSPIIAEVENIDRSIFCLCISVIQEHSMILYIHTCIHTYMHTYMHAYIHTFTHTYSYIYCMHTCIPTYIHACIHAYLHTYIYIHIHVHTYLHIHTYINTYIHTHTSIENVLNLRVKNTV
jgi:hypothetical protein